MGFGLLLAACSTASDTPPPEVELATMPEMTNPEAFTQADQNACAAAGGTYEQAGMLGWFRCTQSFADGGKVCRDGDDCMGRCMSDGTGAAFNEDGTPKPVTGVCAANDNPFGCYATIEDGFSTGTLCVD
mgnify:CR=1 FL=1